MDSLYESTDGEYTLISAIPVDGYPTNFVYQHIGDTVCYK